MDSRMKRWLKLLGSMRMALALLIFLGIAASLGTLVPQGVFARFYLQRYGMFPGKLLLLFGFDHLYSSWWFLGLAGLFGLNIAFCSLQRLTAISNTKGVGSILLHLSILVIFLGAVFSGFSGKSADLDLAVGEIKDLSELGFPGYLLQVKNFRIEYYDTLEPRQYLCTLALEESSGEKLTREIKVNSPLKHKKLKIYQQSYGWQLDGIVGHMGHSQPFQIKGGEELILNAQENLVLKTIFIPNFDEQTESLYSRSPLPENPRLACALIQDSELRDVKFLAAGEKTTLGEYEIQFDDYRYYSGLNVKRDSGIPLVYGGFALLFLGFLLRYITPTSLTIRGKRSWKQD